VRAPLGGRTKSRRLAIRADVRCGCKSGMTVVKRVRSRIYSRDASANGQQDKGERRTMLESRAMKRPSRRFRPRRAHARAVMQNIALC
jgi:hypothetical protein